MDSELTILITGAGAPGIVGTYWSIKNNYDERKIRIIGTDIKEDVVGRYFLDSFYVVPKPSEEDSFLEKIKYIVKKEKVDVILPQVTKELEVFSKSIGDFKKLGCSITISDFNGINFANDKYKLSKLAKELNVPVPEFYLVNNTKDLEKFVRTLGYPKNKVSIKPPVASGMRGYRTIVAEKDADILNRFFNEKPTNEFITLDELKKILGKNFPDLIVMEYLPGQEWTIDAFGYKSNNRYKCKVIPRTRDQIRTGITFSGEIKRNKLIEKSVRKLSNHLKLEYMFGFQFKEDINGVPKLIESNPRIQGTMVMSTLSGFNIIYSSVKYALGEKVPDFNIKWGTKFFRYWPGLAINKDKIIENTGDFI